MGRVTNEEGAARALPAKLFQDVVRVGGRLQARGLPKCFEPEEAAAAASAVSRARRYGEVQTRSTSGSRPRSASAAARAWRRPSSVSARSASRPEDARSSAAA